MVTMKDIAKACQVSVATVSKALNAYSDIGAETREKIKAKAEEMGYYPNSSARALKTKRTYNLGVLFVDEASSGLTHDFFSHVLESFKKTAEFRGYDITFTSNRSGFGKMSYLEHCRYRGVDGVVIACIDFQDPSVQELVFSDLPIVTIDHVFDNRISVVSDNFHGMQELLEYVLAMGHRKIAYIHGADSSVTRARLNCFYHTMSNLGIQVPDEYDRLCPYRDVTEAGTQTEFLMKLPDPPTCILYPDDLSAIGGISVLTQMGLKIGEDISIAGYDGIFVAGRLNPPITTVVQDTESIGRTAAEKLISLIENPKATIIERILVPGRLEKGGSVARIGE